MQTTTVVFMVLVLTLLWGGFAALLVHSMRTEKGRNAAADAEPGPDGG